MEANRNRPCPCGSGKKFKNCCANKKRGSSSAWVLGAGILVFGIIGAWAVTASFRGSSESDSFDTFDTAIDSNVASLGSDATPPGKVWDQEHGHYHDADNPDAEPEGVSLPGSDPSTGPRRDGQPPGPAPPGKVWSSEHGHWHHIEPGIEPPPGKTWSPEHGHWHDASGQADAIAPKPGESRKKWNADHGHYHEWSDEHGHWHDPGHE